MNERTLRRRAMVKNASTAYEIASNAADMIMNDGYDDADDALFTAIDDELMSDSSMMEVVREYGDTSDIWRAFAESSGYEDFISDCWSELDSLVPDDYDDWADYINSSFDEGDVMDALSEISKQELVEDYEDYDERFDYLFNVANDATGKDIGINDSGYDALCELVDDYLRELFGDGFMTARRRKAMYRKPKISSCKPIRRACRTRRAHR